MMKPEGRVIMVSGAARGIGRAVVERLLSSGFIVSGGVRDPSRLQPTERISVHRYHAEEIGAAERWAEETAGRWGKIDGVVNVAGINPKCQFSLTGRM
jgi:NAD(P)-dependent dehydrogenase (short-subunit alcohol dehydrogenase family)